MNPTDTPMPTIPNVHPEPTKFRSDAAENQYVVSRSARFCYRRIGPERGVPLALCIRFRGSIDHWDPAFLEVLSNERDVIVFDNTGVGFSSGSVPSTVSEMADCALEFIDALGLPRIDLLGWSMGGFVVQALVLKRRELVRRLIVAGSGPGRVPDMPPTPNRVLQIMGKPTTDEEDVLYLFYPETEEARDSGVAFLRRLDTRLANSLADVAPDGVKAQIAAVTSFGAGVWDRLSELTLPVLVANGIHDVMISAFAFQAAHGPRA